MINDQRPAILHAGTSRSRDAHPSSSRAKWRRHLHHEPPGLLRKMHKAQVRPLGRPGPDQH